MRRHATPTWYADLLASMPQRTIFPQICIALGFPDPEALLSHARAEYDSGERFLEFRLDYLSDPMKGIAVLRRFLANSSDCSIHRQHRRAIEGSGRSTRSRRACRGH
jgi:hypothetical protein